ncbi:hypothetical protein Tco_0112165 [Tanacetum coccineum]
MLLFKMAGSQYNKFRGDKVKVILVLVIRIMLLVQGETIQVDRQGLLNAITVKDKAMLAEAQEAGQILDEEQLAFLADPGVPYGQVVQTIIPNNAAFQTEDLDTYDSDCDDISNEKEILMANISNYGSNIILEAWIGWLLIEATMNGYAWYCDLWHVTLISHGCPRGTAFFMDPSKVEAIKPNGRGNLTNGDGGEKFSGGIVGYLPMFCRGFLPIRFTLLPLVMRKGCEVCVDGMMIGGVFEELKTEILCLLCIGLFHQVLDNFLESSRWFLISRLLSSLLYAVIILLAEHWEHSRRVDIKTIRTWFSSHSINVFFNYTNESRLNSSFWFRISNPTIESSNQPPVKVEVSNELPKVSLVNVSLKNLKFYLAQFDSVVKKRTTTDARTKEIFKNNDLKAQLQDKDTTICKLKDIIKSMKEKSKEENVNYDYGEIETKNVFKEQFDLIKKTRVRTKEHNDSLIDKLNLKSAENEDLKAQIQDKVFVITSLKNDLRKLKGKEIVDIAAQTPSAHTIKQVDILRGIVEQAKAKQHLDTELDFACKHAQRIQELLEYVQDTCPNAIKLNEKKVVVTPKNKVKKVRSKPTCNKKNDRISRTPSRNMKNKVEAQARKVNKKNSVVQPIRDVDVKHSLLNANFKPICATCKKSMFDGDHDKCFLDFVENNRTSHQPKLVLMLALAGFPSSLWIHKYHSDVLAISQG